MKRFPLALLAAGTLAAAALAGPAAADTTTAAPKASVAQTPVLTCGPTSSPGIWGCWNNVVGQYTITFPSTTWCPTEDSCFYDYHGGLKRADIRHG